MSNITENTELSSSTLETLPEETSQQIYMLTLNNEDRIAAIAEILSKSTIDMESFVEMALPEIKMYLHPWLKRGTLALVYAKRGVGKTWFCLLIMLILTRNLSIGKWKTEHPVGCLYIDGEMSASELQERIRGLSRGMPDPHASLSLISAELMHRKHFPVPNIAQECWRKGMYRFLREHPQYRVLVLDNLTSLTSGIDENEKQEWDAINQWLLSLRFIGIAVIMVHHAGKSGTQRGSSAREDNIDISIELSSPNNYKAADGAVFNVEFKKARGVHGEGAENFTLRLHNDGDNITWTTDTTSGGNRDVIVALLGNGTHQRDIPDLLSCNKSWVSKVKNAAIKDGYLNEDSTFTTVGKERYGALDIDRYYE